MLLLLTLLTLPYPYWYYHCTVKYYEDIRYQLALWCMAPESRKIDVSSAGSFLSLFLSTQLPCASSTRDEGVRHCFLRGMASRMEENVLPTWILQDTRCE